MAKKKELSLEEKLEAALVPREEWPYEVPENWCWIKLGDIVEIIMGQSPMGTETTDDTSFTPLIGGASDMGELYPKVSKYTKKPTKLSTENDIIISVRATLGKPIFSDGIYCLGRGVAAFRSQKLNNKYLRYFLINNSDYLYDVATGTTFSQVSKEDLYGMKLPLSNVNEQQRIVDRIDSLFEQLDRAKDLIHESLDSFENRKAAILHNAFTGELTKKWREENGVSFDSWEEKELRDIASFKSGYAFNSKMFRDSGMQVIRIGNLYNGKLDLSRNPVYLAKEEIDEKIINKSLVKKGDILITLTGTKYKRDYGYAVKIEEDKELLLNQRILSMYPEKVQGEYLLYYLKSEIFRDIFFSNETGGVNQGNVSSKFVESIKIPMPTLDEQTEISNICERILSKEQSIFESINILEEIDLIKKSILSKAFRGELNTNDIKDISAINLIREII